jgi:hypothetical protein
VSHSRAMLAGLRKAGPERLLPIFFGLAGLLAFHLIFHRFFPDSRGLLGDDYSLFLPKLLDGYSWYRVNSVLAVPWFTPGFCGGLPMFADPQGIYYSLPQFLTVFVNPLTSVYLTLFAFSAIGYVGFYLLARRTFELDASAAVFAATAFLFNGFVVHRFMAGAPVYHSFMMVPLIAYTLLRSAKGKPENGGWQGALGSGIAAGIMVAYMFYSGMVNAMLPAFVSLAVILLIFFLDRPIPAAFWQTMAIAIVVTLGLCASKLVASGYYVTHVDRNFYHLPGIPSLTGLSRVILESLFFKPPTHSANLLIVHSLWNSGGHFQRHEFEYGVTFVPLLFLLIGVIRAFLSAYQRGLYTRPVRPARAAKLFLIIAGLLLPVALNYYSPAWNEFLKSLPVVGASSNLLRWISVYIPVVILVSAMVLHHLRLSRRMAWSVVFASASVIVGLNATADTSFYNQQQYDPRLILGAYRDLHSGKRSPEIRFLVTQPPHGRISPNNAIAFGASQVQCYEPMFGYYLSFFPRGSLHVGLPTDTAGGYFNMKNPACYTYPKENGCRPGGQFRVTQRKKLEAFLHYRPYAFAEPVAQELANRLTVSTLLLILALGLAGLLRWVWSRWGPKQEAV